ncbi:Integrator complex subunit 2, variant 2 [Entomophthora muscae]|uniref:Integrator complex subunit 2, variant 2 n=1 Tax=Entomophthora muscae TaxID=34485 RepID=A0ACC2UCD8_9FUNG|nr:Integrator complex subunit 2, variant 2 [Entomophthora muscae]
MSGLSEVATYLYSGGDPELKPEYDYTLFLPFLVYRDGDFKKLASFDKSGEINLAKDILTLDLEAVKFRAEVLNKSRLEAKQNCYQNCMHYLKSELFNKAGLIYEMYLTINRSILKDSTIKEAFVLVTSTSESEKELRYIIHLIMFHDQAMETLSNLIRLLLVGQPPMELAMSFIASTLFDFEHVLSMLLRSYRAQPKLQPYISGWILAILSTFPHLSETIGFHLSGWKVSPGVIRAIPFSSISFQLAFLSSLLNSHTHNLMISQAETKPDVGQVSLVGSIDWVKDGGVDTNCMAIYFQKLLEDFLRSTAFEIPQLCAFLRVMTSFKLIYCMKVGTLPLSKVFSMLKPYLPNDDAPKSLLDLCLCFVLVAGQEFLMDKTASRDALGEMMEGLFNFHFEAIVHIVTAVRSNNLEAVASYYASVLGFQLYFDTQLISRLKGLFSFAIFDAQTLADRICSVTSVDYSSKKVSLSQANQKISYLLGCGIKMIRDKGYIEHRIDLQSWVCSLLANLTTLPIHPYLPALIKEYVACVTQDTQIAKIQESILNQQLHPKNEDWSWQAGPKEIMFLYYALLYNERLAELWASSPDLVSQLRYSDGFYDEIPVKQIMLFVEENHLGPGMDGFRAEFSGLVRSTFAHFFGVTATLFVNRHPVIHTPDPKYPTWHELKGLGCLRSSKTLQEALHCAFQGAAENPRDLQLILEFLKAQPSHTLLSCADKLICQGIPTMLYQTSSHGILDAYFEIWNLINNLAPEKLWSLTVNSARFLPTDAPKLCLRNCRLQDLLEDPLLLSRINANFFRIPQLFQIFLTMMDSVSNASRSRFHRIFRYRTPKQKSLFGMEEVRAMIYLQDTAVIQMLFELCLQENHAENPENIHAIRRMAFNFIHLQFVETSHYIKLVHFQTYSHDLIPLAVENIPSLHFLTESLNELLVHPDPSVHWFALVLASHVVAKYPTSKNLSIVEGDVMNSIKQQLGRMNLISDVPEPELWEAKLIEMGAKQKDVMDQEMLKVKWAHENLSYDQIGDVIFRISTAFPLVSNKFLSWIEHPPASWNCDQLKAKLEALSLKEDDRSSKRQKLAHPRT